MVDRKPRILFLNVSPTVAHMKDMSGLFEFGYMGPLAETGQAEFDTLWVGPWMDTRTEPGGVPMDWSVFQRCVEYRPDVLFVYGWWLGRTDAEKANYPALLTFYLVRRLLNIKVVSLLFDLAPRQFAILDNLTSFCNVVFTYEDHGHFRAHSRFPNKHLITSPTYSPKLYHGDPASHRDFDIAFVGGIGGRYPVERTDGIAALRADGLEVTAPGGRSSDQVKVSNGEYSDVLKRAKITLNWSRHISRNWFQAKGRIFEATLAGSMLLCEECEEVNAWLEPYVDYVPFSDNEDLVCKARYYLENDGERLKIARRGNETALSKYNADTVWGEMIGQMRDTDLYVEGEAVQALRRNASSNELQTARFFQTRLQDSCNQFDAQALNDAVGLVINANNSYLRKLYWNDWYLTALRWRTQRYLRRRGKNLLLRLRSLHRLRRQTWGAD